MDIKKALEKIDEMYDSALHTASEDDPRDQPCPTCGEEDVLTRLDVEKGYQCDDCADRAEGKNQYESKKPSLKDYFQQISEDATAGMKPLPILDPKNQQVGAGVVTSKNPAIQKILKNLTPQDLQVVQTMQKTGTTGTQTSSGAMQPMKEEVLDEKAPPGMENFIKKSKASFKEKYGDRWEEVLYATAWSMYNKKHGKNLEESKINIDAIRDQFERNEDNNYHTENAVLLANTFGDDNEKAAAKAALDYHKKHGGYDYSDPEAKKHVENTVDIVKKYFPKLSEKQSMTEVGRDASAELARRIQKKTDGEETAVRDETGKLVTAVADAFTFWTQQKKKAGGWDNIDWYSIGVDHGKKGVIRNPPYGVGSKAVNLYFKGLNTSKKGVAEGHADQQRKIFKKNGKPVGEVGIDRESSPGVGQWYMKCYLNGIDNAGYDSYEEAVAELKHCLKQGVEEAIWDRPSQSYVPRDGKTFGQTNHPREEHCDACGDATGHAGPGEDSNVDDEGNVYCDDCYAKQQGIAEGYILKKTKVEKTFTPGDPDEYYTSGGADVTTKDTDYEIINNKTGQVVGVASWTTNDYFGPGALKITMKNGATRYLDIWDRERGNPQTAFNRFMKDPKTSKKYKEQGVAEGTGSDRVYFKVIDNTGTGMPPGFHPVSKIEAIEDGYYIELDQPGLGMNYTKHNYKNFALRKDSPKGMPITGKQAYNIVNKQGVAEGSDRDMGAEIKAEIKKSEKLKNATRLFYYQWLMKSDIAAATSYEKFINSWAGIQWFKKHKDEIQSFVDQHNKRFLTNYKVDYPKEGVAEGSRDKVHLKTPKYGLADHPGRDTGVGLRTFAQTPEQDRCSKCNTLYKNHYKQGVAEGKLNEKWGTETKVSPSEKGKYEGKTKAELLKHYNKLKNSGPHKKGSKEYGTMRELAFAIRAKSGWGKVKEAERPSDQVDMGAGLGAGRSQTVLESNMKKTCEAAYHEGKSHGLGGQSYTCRYDEGTDEHHHYHRGFKEGLDECYGIDPMRGVVDETMAATVPGMASQAMDEAIKELDFDSHGKVPSTVPGTECDMDEGALGALAGGALGARVGGFSGAMTGARLGSKLQDKITDLDEMDKTEYMKHMAKKTPGKTFKAFGQTFRDDEVLESDYTFESLDRQLNALLNENSIDEGIFTRKETERRGELNEGVSVSISKGQQGGHDSVSVTATDSEADNLLAFIKHAGMGLFADEQKASDYGAPVTHDGHAEVEDHDSVLDIMKKMSNIEKHGDYEEESSEEESSSEGCGCGQTPCGCAHLEEVESEDQMEFEVAEDATEVAMTNADEESEAKTDQALAISDQQDDEKLDEWANNAMQKGTEEAFTTGDEFMLDTISSGLNKKKSTGQATIPVNAAQKDRLGYNESISDWKKLAGI